MEGGRGKNFCSEIEKKKKSRPKNTSPRKELSQDKKSSCYTRQILLFDLTEVFPYLPSSLSIPDLTGYISDMEIS